MGTDADQRHADVNFAINDAFKRARRRLQDQVRRLQGHVKTHEPRAEAAWPTTERQRIRPRLDELGIQSKDEIGEGTPVQA